MRVPLTFVAIVLLCNGCAHSTGSSYITVTDVYANPKHYIGQRVNISGYLIYKPSLHGLWTDRQSFENFNDEKNTCLSIFDFRKHEKTMKYLNGKNVRARGTIYYRAPKQGEIALAECSSFGVSISFIELSEESSN